MKTYRRRNTYYSVGKSFITMANDILTVVIDERKQLERMDEVPLMQQRMNAVRSLSSSRPVFKDYLLSTEVFYIEPSLN